MTMQSTPLGSAEIQALRHSVRDLTALATLSASWRNSGPTGIAESLADVVQRAIAADFIYIRLHGPAGQIAYETTRPLIPPPPSPGADGAAMRGPYEIGKALEPMLKVGASDPSPAIANPFGGGTVRLAITPLGWEGEYGFLVGGSQEPNFPDQMQRLLLSVAANQAAVVLQQRRAEEELRTAKAEAERRAKEAEEARSVLQTIFDNIPEGVVLVGGPPDFPILANSRYGQELLQQPVDTAVGISSGYHAEHYGLLMPDGACRPGPQDLPLYRASRYGERVNNVELLIERPDGSRIPVLVDAAAVRDQNGRIIGAVNCWRDISNRKQFEEELREREKRLSYALDATTEGVWDWNIKTGEVLYSRRWIESLGYSPDEVLPHVSFWQSLVHPEDMPRVEQVLRAHFEGRTSVYVCENRLRQKSGEYRWNLDRGKVVEWDKDGKPLRMVGADTDISERKQAEQALRENEERLRIATQTGKVGVWDWDIVANRVSWTDSLYAIHGLSKAEFGATVEGFTALVHPDDRALVSKAIEGSLRHGTPYELEFRALKPDGQVIWLFTNAVVLHRGEKPVRMIGATVDITERKRAEEAAREQAEEMEKLMEVMPVAVWIARDPACQQITGNRAGYKLLRMPAGSNLSKSAPPGERPVGFKIVHAGKRSPAA